MVNMSINLELYLSSNINPLSPPKCKYQNKIKNTSNSNSNIQKQNNVKK